MAKTLRVLYNCSKCPAFCCTYERIQITKKDLRRIASRFKLTIAAAQRKFTKQDEDKRMILRHRADEFFDSHCMFLDPDKRVCTIYDARPNVCRDYPYESRCGYYDFLTFTRRHQGDENIVALT
jgi:Predicted Fe-S-cluster oxidoreductase